MYNKEDWLRTLKERRNAAYHGHEDSNNQPPQVYALNNNIHAEKKKLDQDPAYTAARGKCTYLPSKIKDLEQEVNEYKKASTKLKDFRKLLKQRQKLISHREQLLSEQKMREAVYEQSKNELS